MEHAENLFGTLTAILATAIVAALLLHRIRQSILLGYFLCGVLIGPGTIGLVRDPERIAIVSETGVILLLFSLGIEFSFSELRRIGRIALRGGTVQFVISALFLGSALAALGLDPQTAFLAGALAAMSSTAIALRVFEESEYAGGAAGRLALGIAIFQDLLAVGIILLMPVFAGRGGPAATAVAAGVALAKCAAFLGVGVVLSRHVVPRVLAAVERTRSNELFTLAVLALCAGIAWLGSQFGLSLALGAFVAGLIVSETIYSHRILADILPFKHLYLALFFVGVGIQIDPRYCLDRAGFLVAATLGLIVLKGVAAFAGGIAAGFPARPAIAAGLGLSSVGEFSLVLFLNAFALGLVPETLRQGILACATLSMGATPILMKLATPLARFVEARVATARQAPGESQGGRRVADLAGHAVICGYGTIGETLNEALRKIGVPTLIIELNAETVKALVRAKQPCLFADIAHEEALRLANIERARLLVITVPVLSAATAAIRVARRANPDLHVICRARYPQNVQPLRDLGVNAIVDEEATTSLEFLGRTLRFFDQSAADIADQVRQSRFAFGVEE